MLAPVEATSLAALTTLRVGGPVDRLTVAESAEHLIAAVTTAGPGTVLLGGGSNTVAADAGAPHVIHPAWAQVSVDTADTDTVLVEAGAGASWADLAERAVAEGWSGFEALVGIPGSVGAAPVQNIGAYGHEVAELIETVAVWDRLTSVRRRLTVSELGFGYRTSAIRRSVERAPGRGAAIARFIVLSVAFRARRSATSAPIAYAELARTLGVPLGGSAPSVEVAQTVLALRRSKGMLLDPADHDTWSAGSYFVNPVLAVADAAALPADAPRFAAGTDDAGQPLIKTSAAWLMVHAGIGCGWGVNPRATTSTKHVLALTNRGGATARDIRELERAIVDRVHAGLGVTLAPEPIILA